METFKFIGEWETTISLSAFAHYYADVFTAEGKNTEKRENPTIDLIIADTYGDPAPDPSQAQLNTIHYFQEKSNQIAVIDSILRYVREDVYAFYQEHVFDLEEYPESYPPLGPREDFYRYFRLDSISIHDLVKNNFAYCSLTFQVKLLDEEHGLAIDLHRDRCLDHGPAEGTQGLKMAEELGLTGDLRAEMHELLDNEPAIFHTPDPKYGVLKPWQIDANRRFPSNAYRTGADDLLIEAIKTGKVDLSRIGYLIQRAKQDQRVKLVAFFESLDSTQP